MNVQDAMVVFDMKAVLDELHPIEKNYLEFLELSKSFLGWLLTLSEEEFDHVDNNVHFDYTNGPEDAIAFLFPQIEMYQENRHMVLLSELNRNISEKKHYCTLIRLVRMGLATYTVAKNDMDWEFDITPQGLEYVQNEVNRKEGQNE